MTSSGSLDCVHTTQVNKASDERERSIIRLLYIVWTKEDCLTSCRLTLVEDEGKRILAQGVIQWNNDTREVVTTIAQSPPTT